MSSLKCLKSIRILHKLGFPLIRSLNLPRLSSTAADNLNPNREKEWDIVISGGGLVGSAMACALGTSEELADKRVVLLEGGPPIDISKLADNYSNRVSALNPGSKNFLDEIGVWDSISKMRMTPVKRMQIWESLSNPQISFQQPAFESDIAYIVENSVTLKALAGRLDELKDRVTVWNRVKVVEYNLPKISQSKVELKLEDGTKIETKLLIGADGFNSLVRKTMNVQYISFNYKQQAIVANLNFAEPIENNVAWQKFLPTGPIAFLPLNEKTSSLVWTVTPEMAKNLMAMEDDAFTDSLNSALWRDNPHHPLVKTATKLIDELTHAIFPSAGSTIQLPPSVLTIEKGTRATFPLGLGHATKYVGPSVALLGDAAHRVHPLAGLGVNLGFGDAQCLTKKIADNVYSGYQINFLHGLASYETERQCHNVPVMAVIDGINRLYSNDFLPAVLLRSMGLQLTNYCNPLKNQLMRVASK